VMFKPEVCESLAIHCEKRAKTAHDSFDQQKLLALAAEWRKMAAQQLEAANRDKFRMRSAI
jgi:hypothetical protein